jgi:exopolyphosphatase/guanosine-5'-triphosphate,3'-diphosphate pyrophosphatase
MKQHFFPSNLLLPEDYSKYNQIGDFKQTQKGKESINLWYNFHIFNEAGEVMRAEKNYYAIIDIGSNSIRLVIYTQEFSLRLHEAENVKAVAKLKNYLDSDNYLSESGIQKLIQTLKSFKEVVNTYQLDEFICVATAAVRQAKNQTEILNRVYEATGWELRILSEDEEAYYGYLAVVNSTTIKEGITIDIGGGSTEITYFENRHLKHAHSFPFGALTLQRFFTTNEPVRKQMKKLQRFLVNEFRSLDWLKGKSVPLIAIGGSARNLAQIHQNLIAYPLAGLHQYLMTGNHIEKVCHYLAQFDDAERGNVEGLSKDRADTILPASLVFLILYETIGAKGFILSRKGLRDGFFYEYLAEDDTNLYPNVLKDSILELVYEYELDRKQIEHTSRLADQIFDQFIIQGIGDLNPDDWIYLRLGCYVYHLGNYIDSESSSQHTFYLLANRTIDGLLHVNRLKLALLASFKNKTAFQQYLAPFKEWLSEKEQERLYILGALLKFVYSLDATRRQVVRNIDLKIGAEDFQLTIHCNQDYMPEAYQTEKQKKHLEKAIGRNIHLHFVNSNRAARPNI